MVLNESKAKARKRQIDCFIRRVPSAQCISPDGSEWAVSLNNEHGSRKTYLTIIFPEYFPTTAPHITIHGNYTPHPWISSTGVVVGHPLLCGHWNWYSDLGTLIFDILRELNHTTSDTTARQQKKTYYPPESSHVQYEASHGEEQSNYDVAVTKGLNSLSNERLHEMQANDTARRKYIFNLPEARPVLESLIDDAAKTGEMKRQVTEMVTKIEELDSQISSRWEAVTAHAKQVEKVLEKQNKIAEAYQSRNVVKVIEKAAMEQKNKALSLKTDLTKRVIDWPQFEERFLKERKVFHTMMACSERISHGSSQAA